MFRGKKILVGITGGIAAYKAAFLVRLLVKQGAEVKVLMTPSAHDFITPLTLATLSKNPVMSDFVADRDKGTWNNHVELGLWADLMVMAPATANTIAKMANGVSDNLLLAVYLSARCPVWFAPAMDLDMYVHPATKANINKLVAIGNVLIDAEEGELASGLSGDGRMAEPETIVEQIKTSWSAELPLKDKKLLVTAGPTQEAIDPVRFIGNRSSGKMGMAIAERAAALGAYVTLIIGPTGLQTECNNITRVDVISTKEMYDSCMRAFPKTDIAILCAAVADYVPKEVADQKIKKTNGLKVLELVKTNDILAELGRQKNNKQLLVGFALETENEVENAQKKLRSKNLDFIVLNSLNDEGAGFEHDTNKVTIIDKTNKIDTFELKSKTEVAKDILNKVLASINA